MQFPTVEAAPPPSGAAPAATCSPHPSDPRFAGLAVTGERRASGHEPPRRTAGALTAIRRLN
jgi:hypothetical protein